MSVSHSFQRFLKTLGEAAWKHVKFLLATDLIRRNFPLTVLSRCLQFSFEKTWLPEKFVDHLKAMWLGEEMIRFDEESYGLLGRGRGLARMRDALSLTDQAIAFGDGALQIADCAFDARHHLSMAGVLPAGSHAPPICPGRSWAVRKVGKSRVPISLGVFWPKVISTLQRVGESAIRYADAAEFNSLGGNQARVAWGEFGRALSAEDCTTVFIQVGADGRRDFFTLAPDPPAGGFEIGLAAACGRFGRGTVEASAGHFFQGWQLAPA